MLLTLGGLVSGIALASLLIFTAPTTSAASTCPQDKFPETNILYCGMSGGTNVADAVKSFQTYYNQNSDKSAANTSHIHSGDLQTIYNYGGASSSLVNSMSATNTFLATTYSDGTIKLSDGTIVATDVRIAARGTWFDASQKSKYTLIPGTKDVYMRSYSTYFMPDNIKSVPTLVHIDPATGKADFAAWEPCGNLVTFTPVTPPHSISCTILTPHEDGSTDAQIDYTFTVQATAKNMTINSYDFDFGDGNTVSIPSTQLTASASHSFKRTDAEQTIPISAVVNGSIKNTNCETQIVVSPKPPKQEVALACVDLRKTAAGTNAYTFTGHATASNTTITKYVFSYGDGTSETITTDKAGAATPKAHTYKYRSAPYTARVTVYSATDSSTKDSCTTTIKTTKTAVKAASTLVNTGPGSTILIFGAASTIGTIVYRTILRRKLRA